jgi:23S rRNA pseudouridine2605 synthase
MESMGLKVNRLIRTAYGPFQLGKLPKGAVREITGKVLKEQLPEYFR